MRPVLVEWLDAFDGPQGWLPHEYAPEPVRPHTVGFLGEELLPEYTTVYSTYYTTSEGTYYSNPVHIPNGMVAKVTFLDCVVS